MNKTFDVKHVEKSNGVIVTPVGRAAFAWVFEPNPLTIEDGKQPKYTCALVFRNTGTNLTFKNFLVKKIEEAAIAKWGDKVETMNLRKAPLHNASTKSQYEGFDEDSFYINLSNTTKPAVIDRSGTRIIDNSRFYSGCYTCASFRVAAWQNKFGAGVSFFLNNLLLWETADSFTKGSTKAEDDFEVTPEPVEGDFGSVLNKTGEAKSNTGLADLLSGL